MGYLVKYSDFYGTPVPDNSIELILLNTIEKKEKEDQRTANISSTERAS